MDKNERFRKASVIEALPSSRFSPHGGKELFRCMRGATIVVIGSMAEEGLEGGGLIIDYRLSSGMTERAVLAFNESGMWIFDSVLGAIEPTPV
ncbi:hypothetical protein VQ045_21780 [Aurantimonas sp. E1-2-R+4]|uniref:hypothetical protein n=1 Tax=Aurantimonas sp. E1-2-R+4 TaxID=3113714 RepID=UPI002F95872A